MNKLAQYLDGKDYSVFAAQIDVHPSTVTRLVNNDLHPKAWIAWEIQKATGGKVKVQDWPKPKQARK